MDAPDLLLEIYRRHGSRDLESMADLCDPDFRLVCNAGNDRAPFAGVYQGREALIARQAEAFDLLEYERFEVVEIFGTPDKAAARVAVRFRSKETDRVVDGELGHFVSVRDGKIVEFHEFFDTDLFARSLGQ